MDSVIKGCPLLLSVPGYNKCVYIYFAPRLIPVVCTSRVEHGEGRKNKEEKKDTCT